MKEKKGSFLSEFAQSWVGQLSFILLIVLTVLIVMLQLEWFPFHNLSVFLSEDKYDYTFKMIEITVSILAFSALAWSISYQRDELLQSRHELKVQSEDVNRSIDEANKNFDRELLLEFYRKIDQVLDGEELEVSSFLIDSLPKINQGYIGVIKKVDSYARGGGGANSLLQSIFTNINKVVEEYCPKEERPNETLASLGYARACESSHISMQFEHLKKEVFRLEKNSITLIFNMLRYAKNKGINLDDPVFSLLSACITSSNLFENKITGYRIKGYAFFDICERQGLISEFRDPETLEVTQDASQEFDVLINEMEYLGLIREKESFIKHLKASGFSRYIPLEHS